MSSPSVPKSFLLLLSFCCAVVFVSLSVRHPFILHRQWRNIDCIRIDVHISIIFTSIQAVPFLFDLSLLNTNKIHSVLCKSMLLRRYNKSNMEKFLSSSSWSMTRSLCVVRKALTQCTSFLFYFICHYQIQILRSRFCVSCSCCNDRTNQKQNKQFLPRWWSQVHFLVACFERRISTRTYSIDFFFNSSVVVRYKYNPIDFM